MDFSIVAALVWAACWCTGMYRLVIKTVWIGVVSAAVPMLGMIGDSELAFFCLYSFALMLDFDDRSVRNTDRSGGSYRV